MLGREVDLPRRSDGLAVPCMSAGSLAVSETLPPPEATMLPTATVPHAAVKRPLCRECTGVEASSVSAKRSCNSRPHYLPKKKASRQSGKVGVTWDAHKKAWVASYNVEGKLKRVQFWITNFLTASMTWRSADRKALQAAIRARNAALEIKGVKPAKKKGIPHSGMTGVYWDINKHAWKVQISCTPARGKKKKQAIHGGYFKPKQNTLAARNDELQKAKQTLVQLLKQHNITYVQGSDCDRAK